MNEKSNRTGSDMAEDLSALVFDLDVFPSSRAAKEILEEEGIDTSALKSWASEKLKGVRARQRLATAKQRRLALEARLDSLRQAAEGTMSGLREGILDRIQVLGASNPEAAQVYCRKFEEIPDDDLARTGR
jgi:hypothetical protein